jgi:hypothetical protein
MTPAPAAAARPKRRELRFTSYTEVLTEVARLQERGYQRAGTWTLTENCEHLRIFMRCSMHGFGDTRVPWPIRMLGPLLLWGTLRRKKIPAGVQAPAPFLPPARTVDDPAVIDAFRQTLHTLEQFPGPFQPSPLFGRLSLHQWQQLHLIHAAHHLGFLVPNS